MNEAFAKELCQLNTRFYAEQSESFSATRASSWGGWARVASLCRETLGEISEENKAEESFSQHEPGESVLQQELGSTCFHRSGTSEVKIRYPELSNVNRVLDVACGNLRFEKFLADEFSEVPLAFTALDNCEALLPDALAASINFVHCDVMDALQQGTALPAGPHAYDLAVSFGFMHHVPLSEWRERLLSNLIDALRPGGIVAISLWRFADNEAMAKKAQETTPAALEYLGWQDRASQLELGDYLIGWQNKPGAYRYCHSFTDADSKVLVQSVAEKARLIDCFRADGRTHNLNEYLVLQKK